MCNADGRIGKGLAIPYLALAQRGFRLLSIGDIPDHDDEFDSLIVLTKSSRAVAHMEEGAILADEDILILRQDQILSQNFQERTVFSFKGRAVPMLVTGSHRASSARVLHPTSRRTDVLSRLKGPVGPQPER